MEDDKNCNSYLFTDLFLVPVEWPEYNLHLTKGSTSVSSSEVNMAEATPVTETAILQVLPVQSTTTDPFLEAEEWPE